MKILDLELVNYASLKRVSLTGLSDRTILVGKNGSGKSFIFGALELFFKEFSLIGGSSSVSGNNYYWHRRITREPIQMRVKLHFSQREAMETIQPWVGDSVGKTGQDGGVLEVTRNIVANDGWHTTSLIWQDTVLIENDEPKPLAKESLTNQAKAGLRDWVVYFLDDGYSSQNVGGRHLLVSEKDKVAYLSNEGIDSLVTAGWIETSSNITEIGYQDWAQGHGFQFNDREPTVEEAPHILAAVSTRSDSLSSINEALVNKLRASFLLIPATRDALGKPLERTSFIDAEVASNIKEVSLSQELPLESRWERFTTLLEALLEKRFEPNPTEVLVKTQGMRFPASFVGGGEQSMVALVWRLMDDYSVVAIEEPENHLHPGLARRWIDSLRRIAPNSQCLISTHASGIVDKDTIRNNWIVRLEERESKLQRVEETDDFKTLLAELGVVPSDVFFKDIVVFVEGGSEREAVLPIWAEKYELDLWDNPRIGLLSVGGENRLKDNLRIWLEIIEHAPADYLVVVDHHSAGIVNDLVNQMNIPIEKFIVLPKHCIEDYYPNKLIIEALAALYGIEGVKPKDISTEPKATAIKRILEANQKIVNGWKIAMGTYVASRMSKKEIPVEVVTLITRLKNPRASG